MSIDLAPARYFTNSLGMEFVEIPAGSFMMGFRDPPKVVANKLRIKQWAQLRSNYPRHLVEISGPLYMQTTEVTQKQLIDMMGHAPNLSPVDLPVKICYPPDIKLFIRKLNKLEGGTFKYRLPTEAEWEYAARAGTTSPYYTGETITTDQANYDGELGPFGYGGKGVFRKRTMPVKSLSPNPWGLYHMLGNVGEVCSDTYDAAYYCRSPLRDPKNTGGYYWLICVRGGDWLRGPVTSLPARRFVNTTRIVTSSRILRSLQSLRWGFRLVAERLTPNYK